jgi:hypothetical protein
MPALPLCTIASITRREWAAFSHTGDLASLDVLAGHDAPHVVGLTISFEALFQNNRDQIVSLSDQYRIVTIYPTRNFTELGGLLSYGPSFPVSFRQLGAYVGKILKGVQPGLAGGEPHDIRCHKSQNRKITWYCNRADTPRSRR